MQLPFTGYQGNPILEHGDPGSWDSGDIMGPNILFENDTYYLFYFGSTNILTQSASIGLATSTNGYEFDKVSIDDPIFGPDGTGFDAWAVVDPVVIKDGGEWILFYGAKPTAGFGAGPYIGQATATNPEGPWIRQDNPILESGSSGEWDSYFMFPSSIIKTDSGYLLYYAAGSSFTNYWQTGLAYFNGSEWVKYDDPSTIAPPYAESDPVLKLGYSGHWDEQTASMSCVKKIATGLEMFYCGFNGSDRGIGYALSEDGINWDKFEDNPIFTYEDDPFAFVNGYNVIEIPTVFISNGEYFMYYDYGIGPGYIGMATADALAQIIHVPGDQPNIQAAIDIATHGDTVLVDEGTYYENINFLGKAITVTSSYLLNQDSSYIYNTIIDGGQPANPDTASVVSFVSGEDTTSVLCGFTIQNGSGTFKPTWDARLGGGIICDNAGPKIIHNHIKDNELDYNVRVYGGGISAYDLTSDHTIIIRSNIIENNNLSSTAFYPGGGLGAGIEIYEINCIIEDNHIISNTTTGRPYGVGICAIYCHAFIRNNTIEGNTGNLSTDSGRGAGLFLENNLPGTEITGNTIINNELNHISGTASGGGGIGILNIDDVFYNEVLFDGNIIQNNVARVGGGMFVKRAFNSTISNNVIQGNEANFRGGGILYTYSSKSEENKGCGFKSMREVHAKSKKQKDVLPILINNTITDNSSVSYGGGLTNNMGSDFIALNNIFYNNISSAQGNEMYLYTNSNAFLYNNNVDTNEIAGNGNWVGENNINEDPLFDMDGYHILSGSPCIEEGITEIEINGEMYYCPDHDIDGQERPLNTTADIGVDEVLITRVPEREFSSIGQLLRNSPNPFGDITTIHFELEADSYTDLSIYDLTGKKVKTLSYRHLQAGIHEINLDAKWLDNGIYFCVLKTNNGTQTNKMIKL
ncbi:MAG: T9SS type A sorting domain-containing protein [Bacteroidales bacterium]|nr:T9SS type A sorting domain-containing protein [Bacteroidales bacterium]